jgi:hypothetical protein
MQEMLAILAFQVLALMLAQISQARVIAVQAKQVQHTSAQNRLVQVIVA